MEGTLLEISFPTIIIQLVNFLILLFFLNMFLYKPLKEAIAAREMQVKGLLDEADSLNAQALNAKQEYDEKIKNAKDEGAKILQTAVGEAEKTKSEIIESGRRDIRHMNERAFIEIERERKKTEDELRAQSASVAVDIATKILRESIDPKTQGAIVEEFVRRIKK